MAVVWGCELRDCAPDGLLQKVVRRSPSGVDVGRGPTAMTGGGGEYAHGSWMMGVSGALQYVASGESTRRLR